MLRRFLPKTTDFFDYFERHSKLTVQACKEFFELTSSTSDLTYRIAKIKELEHDADDTTHECLDALHMTFITPIDRYDIHRLIKRMDDIVDSIDAVSARVVLYDIVEFRSEAREMAEVIYKSSQELEQVVHRMRNLNEIEAINKHCIAVHQFENDGDTLLRKALSRLFREETDPIVIIKWKEIFERLEGATDRCEEVANIIEGVVIEAS
jgi:predicted phosphate transport protein (TIGR00153 family)